jgi:CarD family transcriptional regulator
VTDASGVKWAERLESLAVYPGHGVVRLDAIRRQEISGRTIDFLVLLLVEDGSRIFVPVEKATRLGLRDVITRAEAGHIWKILGTSLRRKPRGGGPWSRRFRDYQEKLKKGSIFEIAEVLADLLRLQHHKELSFGEQRMLESAWTRIVHEIAAAEDLAPDAVEKKLRELVKRDGSARGDDAPSS